MGMSDREPLKICIVAEHASFQFGGEASLPLHYFSRLRARGVETWLIVHGRTREELERLFPNDQERIQYIPDRWFHKLIWGLNRFLPRRVAGATLGTLMMLINQIIQRQMVRDLIARYQVNVVHQPIPVSPRAPSFIFKLAVPVILGPMNGGMEYPPAFRHVESWSTRVSIALGRRSANLVNRIIPGKKLAHTILVANERTRLALPSCITGEVIKIVENGVDLSLWVVAPKEPTRAGPPCFLFIGRLVDWKRVDIALEALARVPAAQLEIIGDGPMRTEWTRLASQLNLTDRVTFLGWRTQPECAFHLRSATALLLPSVYECGGAVVLEAMATGTPVIATAWGGPEDYIDSSCGVLVPPHDIPSMVQGFTNAMQSLIAEANFCDSLGFVGRKKVEQLFDWEDKVDQMLEIYLGALETFQVGGEDEQLSTHDQRCTTP
jgi:glycosyltransferase involved in cell wall biosynthesis